VSAGASSLIPNDEGLFGSADPYQITPYGPRPEPQRSVDPLGVLGAAFRTASPVGSALNAMALTSRRNGRQSIIANGAAFPCEFLQ
jgi:hypothetical protein